jgi:hypothetical protein
MLGCGTYATARADMLCYRTRRYVGMRMWFRMRHIRYRTRRYVGMRTRFRMRHIRYRTRRYADAEAHATACASASAYACIPQICWYAHTHTYRMRLCVSIRIHTAYEKDPHAHTTDFWYRIRIPTYLNICYRMRRIRTSSVGHTLPHAHMLYLIRIPHICAYATACASASACSAYVSIRQHTSAYAAYVSIRYRMRLRMHILTCRIRLQCGNMNPIWNDMTKCPKGTSSLRPHTLV